MKHPKQQIILNKNYFQNLFNDAIKNSYNDMAVEMADTISLFEVLYVNTTKIININKYQTAVTDRLVENVEFIISQSRRALHSNIEQALLEFTAELELSTCSDTL